MYRLASKVRCTFVLLSVILNGTSNQLELENLKQQAFSAIELDLTKDNIVKELFSDFTWRLVSRVL